MLVCDQVVARTFPQLVLSGSQDALITTNTKTVGIEPFAGTKGSLTAPQTRKSSARAANKLRSLVNLSSSFPGKIGDDSFLHADA